jgi:hypothetical protein
MQESDLESLSPRFLAASRSLDDSPFIHAVLLETPASLQLMLKVLDFMNHGTTG